MSTTETTTSRAAAPFVVTTPDGVRIVVAKSSAAALRHVVDPIYTARRAAVADLVTHRALPIETAGADGAETTE